MVIRSFAFIVIPSEVEGSASEIIIVLLTDLFPVEKLGNESKCHGHVNQSYFEYMQFHQLTRKAKHIEELYRKHGQSKGMKEWEAAEYLQGLMGDVGDLAKLIMAKNNLRDGEDIDEKIKHELADCLWSIVIIADKLGIDLEESFTRTMTQIEKKLDS